MTADLDWKCLQSDCVAGWREATIDADDSGARMLIKALSPLCCKLWASSCLTVRMISWFAAKRMV